MMMPTSGFIARLYTRRPPLSLSASCGCAPGIFSTARFSARRPSGPDGLPRCCARRIAEYVGLLIVGPILLVGFIGLAHATLGGTRHWFAGVSLMETLAGWAVRLSPYFMVTVFFTALYMFIPHTRVRWRPA